MNGNIEVARILIENGTDVNKMDKIRKSSLMVRFNTSYTLETCHLTYRVKSFWSTVNPFGEEAY